MSAFVLKIIACITMFIDHIGYVIFDGPSYFNYIGRLAFPIFAFQISEGYVHTHNLKKYFLKLLIFAIVSQIPFMLFNFTISDGFSVNVLFTLLFGLLAIFAYDKLNKFLGICFGIILAVFAQILKFDYGFYGVAIILLFYIFRENKLGITFSFLIATLFNYTFKILPYFKYGNEFLSYAISYYIPYAICTFLSIIILLLYNKKKGPNTRYFIYLFYPLHLFLIFGISYFHIV